MSLLCVITSSQTFQGSATVIGDNSFDITIDYSRSLVVMVLSGRAGVWNGFGFGSSSMQNTYALIMEYTRNDISSTLLWEYTLANHKAGTKLTVDEIRIVSDTTSGSIRTVTIERAIIGTTYSFPTPPAADATSLSLVVMTAIGSIPSDYATSRNAAHTSSNRATISITLTKIDPILLENDVIQCHDCASQTIQISHAIECLSDAACFNATLRCSANQECWIEGSAPYALSGSYIVAPAAHDLDIQCLDAFSCSNVIIDASHALSVAMHCDALQSCLDFELFCPPNKQCKVIGNTIDASIDSLTIHATMRIHASNSWNDIDLSLYTPQLASSTNIMYCATDECIISHTNGAWDCEDSRSLCARNPLVPIESTANKSCPGGDVSTGNVSIGSVDVIATIDCIAHSITLDIAYKRYSLLKWFGLVFNTQMSGDALVFTTGKNNDRSVSLYAYQISGKSADSVVYEASLDWTQQMLSLEGSSLRIVYEQDLDLTQWDVDTQLIQFNIAVGSSLTLQHHTLRTTTTFDLHLTPLPTIAPTQPPSMKPTTAIPTTNQPSAIPTTNPIIATTNAAATCTDSAIRIGHAMTSDLHVIATLNCA
eukprot:152374_1